MKWTIRQEIEGDEAAITRVVAQAFESKPYADENDARLVDGLRDAGALILSLVATHKGQIIGQVALSPATIGEDRYLCIGPLAVLPKYQRKGVGSALMSHALGVARVYGRTGVVLQGDLTYYSRFGFEVFPSVTFAGDGAQFIQVLPWSGIPRGEVRFHPIFAG